MARKKTRVRTPTAYSAPLRPDESLLKDKLSVAVNSGNPRTIADIINTTFHDVDYLSHHSLAPLYLKAGKKLVEAKHSYNTALLALEIAAESITNNKGFTKKAAKEYCKTLQLFAPEIRKEIFFIGIKNDGFKNKAFKRILALHFKKRVLDLEDPTERSKIFEKYLAVPKTPRPTHLNIQALEGFLENAPELPTKKEQHYVYKKVHTEYTEEGSDFYQITLDGMQATRNGTKRPKHSTTPNIFGLNKPAPKG